MIGYLKTITRSLTHHQILLTATPKFYRCRLEHLLLQLGIHVKPRFLTDPYHAISPCHSPHCHRNPFYYRIRCPVVTFITPLPLLYFDCLTLFPLRQKAALSWETNVRRDQISLQKASDEKRETTVRLCFTNHIKAVKIKCNVVFRTCCGIYSTRQ